MAKEKTIVATTGAGNYEVYDYPGRYEDLDDGRRLVRIRMGPLRLGRLRPRQTRKLTAAERQTLPRASPRRTGRQRG